MNSPATYTTGSGAVHAYPGDRPVTRQVLVWDRFVRFFHWSLAASILLVALNSNLPQWLHEGLGYFTLALVAARLLWGFVGRGHARFADFVPGPRRLINYLRDLLHGREQRHLGHNPAAALMILFLLAMVAAIGVTGWLLTTDAYWGDETMETLHLTLVNTTLLAVAIHVGAAIYESLRHKENLILAMFTGKKRANPPSHTLSRNTKDRSESFLAP